MIKCVMLNAHCTLIAEVVEGESKNSKAAEVPLYPPCKFVNTEKVHLPLLPEASPKAIAVPFLTI